jgi:predicted nucleic acid-binding protein
LQVALDTNVLVYAEGLAPLSEDAEKPDRARDLLNAMDPNNVVVPVQALGELYRVLLRKAKRSRTAARAAVLTWHDLYETVDTNFSVMGAALDLAVDHQLSIWDAVILASAAQAGCRLLLSEDMQEGFTWRGLTVVNPVAAAPHPLLAAFLRD